MPRYDYVALTSQGKETHGVIEAVDLGSAREALRRRALLPVKLGLEGAGGVLGSSLNLGKFNPLQFLPVNSRDKQFTFRQLALMVKSGHRLRAALEMLENITSKHALRASIRRMIEGIDRGESFAEALRAEHNIFPRFVPALVEAGERSGTLDQILDEVARSMERARMLRNTLVRALVMPCITLLVAFAVLGFVVVWLVPKLSDFLLRTGGEMHWTMGMLVSANELIIYNYKTAAIGIGIILFVLMAASTTQKGKLILDRVWLSAPIFGRSAVLFEMAQFGGIGTLLIHSGLRQVEALRILAKVTKNFAMRDLFDGAADRLLEGQKMSDALNTPIFDKLARHMVGVGETSGSLDEVLDNIGTYFTDEVETRIQVLFSTMVPAITIVIGVVVAIIYITVILTVLGAVNSVR